MSTSISLLTLPVEVLVQVFFQLEGHQIAKCSSVRHLRFHFFIPEPILNFERF